MRLCETLVVLLGFMSQVWASTRITLDEEAQSLCKKYKRMCKKGKICAVQHFDWPNNITIPVCIPLNFVPAEYKHHVRNLICQLPPETGSCSARYIRWYFNVQSQECTHFRYGGCEGNENNFMSKTDCEGSCLSTPTVSLYEGPHHSALVQMKPAVMQPPVFESTALTNYEAMNGGYNLIRHRDYLMRNDESNRRMRRRLDKEKEKERRRRERKKEKRMRRLRKKKKNRKNKKNRKGRKKNKGRKRKNKEVKVIETENETAIVKEEGVVQSEETDAGVEEADTGAIANAITEVNEKEMDKLEKRKERKRKKRRERNKRRSGKNRNKRRLYKRYKELVQRPGSYKMFSILDQGKQSADQKNSVLDPLT